MKVDLEEIRTLIADYMQSEGCSCCQDRDAHEKTEKKIGELLKVEKYEDGSGYDFTKYRSDNTPT